MVVEIVLYHNNGNNMCILSDLISQIGKVDQNEAHRLATPYSRQQCFTNFFGAYQKNQPGIFSHTCGSAYLVGDQFEFAFKRLTKYKVAVIKQSLVGPPETSTMFLVPRFEVWKPDPSNLPSLKELCASKMFENQTKTQKSDNPFTSSFQYLKTKVGTDLAEYILTFCTVELFIRGFSTQINDLNDEGRALLSVFPSNDFPYQGRLPSHRPLRGRRAARGTESQMTTTKSKEVKVLYQTAEKYLDILINNPGSIGDHIPGLSCEGREPTENQHYFCSYRELVSDLRTQHQLVKQFYELSGLPVSWDDIMY